MTTRKFSLKLLKEITGNFSEDHIIGRGGFGTVYKGVLDDGEEIALKRLFPVDGLDDTQFTNELNNLMRAQHPNIIQLVGYCYKEKNERMKFDDNYIFGHSHEKILCFEYLRGGSLDEHISDESRGLDWPTRFKIIKGICDGLNYLHNGSKQHIYHLDLKPQNILLDENMVPKIGDFGLSRLFPSTQTYVTIKVVGTSGYMPPEFIERREITPKYDVFSLGVIIIRIMVGNDGYFKCAPLSLEEFLEHVHENWGKRLQATMSSYTSEQITTCAEIAFRCVQLQREERPEIAAIVEELNKFDTIESSSAFQIAKKGSWNSERRGRIVFSTTSRPTKPLDIFSCPFLPSWIKDEVHLTDGVSHNYNGHHIPPAALKTLLRNPKLANEGIATDADIDAGHISGLVFISERDDGLETLYIGLHFNAKRKVKVFALADIFGTTDFSGARLEDSGCIGGGFSVGSCIVDHCLIYVSTKQRVEERRSPWTVVYKTNLTTGKTERLTPEGVYDLSPATSPSGKMVAVASFQSKSWNGEVESKGGNDRGEVGLGRKLLIKNGGWPSWGSDNIIFFHRGTDKALSPGIVETAWGVFRYDLSKKETVQVTPREFDAMTPAAISENKVAVATICQKSEFMDAHVEEYYRHIKIFDTSAPGLPPVQITQKTRPFSDHYNPFVMDSVGRIGYHRCRSNSLGRRGDHFSEIMQSPVRDVGLFRVSGVLPAISKDGSKLAFVDNSLKQVWMADSQGLRQVYQERGQNCIFSLVWNQNPHKDTFYFCAGSSSLSTDMQVDIYSISGASKVQHDDRIVKPLTQNSSGFSNAFPSSSPEGNKFVFQSTRDGGEKRHKNLYIMRDEEEGERAEGNTTRLTNGPWTDTHCQWSPTGDWIVFSSTRDWGIDTLDNGLEPWGAEKSDYSKDWRWRTEELDKSPDPGYFCVYLVKATNPMVVIRVMNSGGHIDHPVFSPDGRSIVVTADLAAVSVDPISLPRSTHASRPCGDIFMFMVNNNDPYDFKKNNVKRFRRITHSRYDCGTPAWTSTFVAGLAANARLPWYMLAVVEQPLELVCPDFQEDFQELVSQLVEQAQMDGLRAAK